MVQTKLAAPFAPPSDGPAGIISNLPTRYSGVESVIVCMIVERFECVLVSCAKPSSSSLLLACPCIPLSQPASTYAEYCDIIDEAAVSTRSVQNILLMGDFNLQGVNRDADACLTPDDCSRHIWTLLQPTTLCN
ncbi:hypothetical protein J6590_086845 [Homalodisca vitripennis]|nr:hypothetical protein J6590_086845 [Homalodisca vitripennis]